MKFDLVKEELSTLLGTLTEQFETMDAHKNAIPQIELDIFIKNIQIFYENAIDLKKTNTHQSKNEISEEAIMEETQIQNTPEMTNVQEEVKPEKEAVILNEPKEIVEEITDTEVEKTPSLEKEMFTSESSFDDILEETEPEKNLFSQVKASNEIIDLNKKLAEARGNHSLVEKLQNQQIDSLKSVIGINDKFYFINELFSGDAHKYEDVIYILNNFKKLDDAMQYFSTLKYRYNWDDEFEASEKLIHMLERKFDLIDA